jgi:hypothetical protein
MSKFQSFIFILSTKCNVSRECSSPKLSEATLLDRWVPTRFQLWSNMKQEMAIHRYKIQITRFTREAFIVIKREFTRYKMSGKYKNLSIYPISNQRRYLHFLSFFLSFFHSLFLFRLRLGARLCEGMNYNMRSCR